MVDVLNGLTESARNSYEDVMRKIADGLQPTSSTTAGTLVGSGSANLAGFTSTGATSGFQQAYTSIASVAEANIYSVAAGDAALILNSSILGNASIAPLRVVASTASQAFFDFRGGVISTASINLSAAQIIGVVQAHFIGAGGEGQGFIPIFKGVV